MIFLTFLATRKRKKRKNKIKRKKRENKEKTYVEKKAKLFKKLKFKDMMGKLLDESMIPDNVCFVPLGGMKCECTKDNTTHTTWFIKKINLSWSDATLTYTFVNDDNLVISNPKDVSMCTGQILDQMIDISQNGKEEEFIELYIDGKDVGIEGAKDLLRRRKQHTKKHGYCYK